MQKHFHRTRNTTLQPHRKSCVLAGKTGKPPHKVFPFRNEDWQHLTSDTSSTATQIMTQSLVSDLPDALMRISCETP